MILAFKEGCKNLPVWGEEINLICKLLDQIRVEVYSSVSGIKKHVSVIPVETFYSTLPNNIFLLEGESSCVEIV